MVVTIYIVENTYSKKSVFIFDIFEILKVTLVPRERNVGVNPGFQIQINKEKHLPPMLKSFH